MSSPYRASIHAGTSANIAVAIPFVLVGIGKSVYIQFNCWDNPVYVNWQLSGGGLSADIEIDNNWQPILIPFAALGFEIRSKTAGQHGRYQIIATA